MRLTKSFANKLAGIEGFVKGTVFDIDYNYVKSNYGLDGLKKVEKKMKDLGYPINYARISRTDDYPMGLRMLSLLVIKETFKMTDKDIIKMGYDAPAVSFIVRLFSRFITTPDSLIKNANTVWQKHFSIGYIKVLDYKKNKKYIKIGLYDFKVNNFYCLFLKGYFARILELSLSNKKVKVKETKCAFKKNDYHEFVLTW